MVVERHAGVLGQVRRRAGAGDQVRQPRDVVGLDVRVKDRRDTRALPLGERDVLVHQVDVRVHDGEGAVCLAPEQVRRTRGLVVEELTEVHAGLRKSWDRALTSYQVIY